MRTFEQERAGLKHKVLAEKKRTLDAQEETGRAREAYEKKKSKILQDIIDKDEKIHRLSRQVSDLKREVRNLKTAEIELHMRRMESMKAQQRPMKPQKS